MEKLKFAFSMQNLQQDTTKKAIAGFICAAILLFYPPSSPLTADQMNHLTDQMQALVGLIFVAIAGLSKILAAYHSVIATINLFHNENKTSTVPAQPPKG